MALARVALPIDGRLAEIVGALDRGYAEGAAALLLQAEPGAGKTTRVPPALLDSDWGKRGEIWVLEPRRLAAKLSAERVAEERGVRVGGEVGYLFRFETVVGPETRLKYLTEGLLIRELVRNPELAGVSCVVLDEFHERHLHTDLSFTLLRRLQKTARPDLGLVIMSATLDAGSLQARLEEAPLISVPGRVFPVETEYLGDAGSRGPRLEERVRDAVLRALSDERTGEGNLLVFLPGMGEIRRAEEALAGSAEFRRSGAELAVLHAEMEKTEQARAIRAGGPRRVILSTNVAETSVTLPGVRAVIDSGLHRRAQVSPWTGLPQLATRPISRASAVQRAGRAGRVAPGVVYRLYSRGDYEARAPFERPEIARAELSQTALELLSLGVAEPAELDWVDPPPESAWRESLGLLERLGLASGEGASRTLTEAGREAVRWPVPPRVGALLIEARARGVLPSALRWAAELLEGELPEGDALRLFSLTATRPAWGVDRLMRRLEGLVKDRTSVAKPAPGTPQWDRAMRLAILRGFVDRGAKYDRANALLQLGSGGSAPARDRQFHSELLVVVDAIELAREGVSRGTTQVRVWSELDEEALLEIEPSPIREEVEILTSGGKGRLERVLRWKWDSIALSESRAPVSDESEAASLLASELMKDAAFWSAQPRFAQLRLRLKWLARERGKEGWSELDAASTRELLEQAAYGKLSLAAVREVDLAQFWLDLDPGRARKLEELAPERLSLAHGRKPWIQYFENQAPAVESRMQDFFGQTQTPKILGGRAPLTLHLLAPNGRAVQITQDLAGFWARAYQEVRGELSRRYPRHFWPEDPARAEPPPPRAPRPRR